MKKDREKHVRARFAWRMAKDLPEFQPSNFGHPDRNLVCYKGKSSLTKYVTLKIDKKFTQFSIIITWMFTDRPPIYATPGAPWREPNQDGLSIDLSLLWGSSVRPWKVKYLPPRDELERWISAHPDLDLTDEDLIKAYFYTDLAIDKLIEFGLPYFDSIEKEYASA